MRYTQLHVLTVALAVGAGCATPPSVPPPQPVAWAQTKDELGKLAVGRVVEVEARNAYREGPVPAAEASQLDSMAALAATSASPLALPVAYVMTTALNDLSEAPRGWYYRHKIQLLQSGELITRDERHTFKMGDCVALREKPLMLVPAHVGACEQAGMPDVEGPGRK
jgi:hypothetical protein